MDDHSLGLFEHARSGNRAAVEQLLTEHLPSVRAYVRLRAGREVRERESCSDIVQSACREVLADLDHFEYRDEATFRHWLYEAALRKIIDRHRYWHAERRDAAREIPLAVGADASDAGLLIAYASVCTPSRTAIARERLAQVEQAFETLPEHYRQVITLSRIAGLSHSQVADRMGRSEDSVRNLLSRALAKLAGLLTPASRNEKREA